MIEMKFFPAIEGGLAWREVPTNRAVPDAYQKFVRVDYNTLKLVCYGCIAVALARHGQLSASQPTFLIRGTL